MGRLLLAVAVLAQLLLGVFAVSFPLYKQCDDKWGADQMGIFGNGERAPICTEGCAMSSLSMALFGHGIEVDGNEANPQTLNYWLMANKGYMCAGGDCNNLVLDAPERLSKRIKLLGELPKPPIGDLRKGLDRGDIVYIAHVRNNGHFVLLTGYDARSDHMLVNDPGFDVTAYPYANISGIITYQVFPSMPRALPSSARIPKQYPLFKQCDSKWGSDVMVKQTVCGVGCLMSSTAMAINGFNITIEGQMSNPGVLNAWLRANHGYVGTDMLDEDVVPQINSSRIDWPDDAMHPKNDLPFSTIVNYLEKYRPVIANVNEGRHFVLVVGYDLVDGDTLYINDPGRARDTYSYAKDVVGWRLFTMH